MAQVEHAAEFKVEGMDEGGWSNSEAAKHVPDDVHPEVNVDLSPSEPGWSNTKAAKAEKVADTESKVVDGEQVEDKSAAKKAAAKRSSRHS